MIMHPHFNPRTLINDIGLIRLRSATPSLLQHPFVGVIRLPNITDARIDLTGRSSTVSGFGTAGIGTGASEVLRFITVPVISNQECSDVFQGFITPSNLCVSTAGGRSPCQGDSGGPLTTIIDRNRTIVIGIVSFGTEDCSVGVPSAFARVTSFLSWIESIVNSGCNLRVEKNVGIFMVIVFLIRNFSM